MKKSTAIDLLLMLSIFIFGWFANSAFVALGISMKSPTLLAKIQKEKKLNVVLLNSPTTYYIGNDMETGFEYDLLSEYAKHLGAELVITKVSTTKEALRYIQDKNIHIISSAISKTHKNKNFFNFGPSYFEVQKQVVCDRQMIIDKKLPKIPEDLFGLEIVVGKHTSYQDAIIMLEDRGLDLNVTFSSKYSTEELLEQVSKNKIDCTIAFSNIYTINRRYMPELVSAFYLGNREQLAWVLPTKSQELESDLYEWLNSFNHSGKMDQLKEHYFNNDIYFDYYDTTMFYKRIKSRLPKYKIFFKEAQKKYDLSWRFLASVSYRESHWYPKARSFTGVRGMMMLTTKTAKSLNVDNRLDPKQSILGGAKYLRQIIKTLPKEIKGENRLKFALASYNVGMGHIEDTRKLAKKLGYNENTWKDLKKVLPLLSKKKYYRNLKYGYARGREPVEYVDSIYYYMDVLKKLEDKKLEDKKIKDKKIKEDKKLEEDKKIEEDKKEEEDKKLEEDKKIEEDKKEEDKKIEEDKKVNDTKLG